MEETFEDLQHMALARPATARDVASQILNDKPGHLLLEGVVLASSQARSFGHDPPFSLKLEPAVAPDTESCSPYQFAAFLSAAPCGFPEVLLPWLWCVFPGGASSLASIHGGAVVVSCKAELRADGLLRSPRHENAINEHASNLQARDVTRVTQCPEEEKVLPVQRGHAPEVHRPVRELFGLAP